MKQRQAIAIRWNGISASVKEKIILDNCEGYCKPGEMLAIMGPSGAGKTTLLSLICQKQSASMKIEGKVYANNQQFSASQFYNFGSFVYQNDVLHENLTVRQTLMFASLLKHKTKQEAQKRVNQLIELFELQKCEHSYVGGQMRKGISGGEKKRVCVAVEIVEKPSLIILDEPTSGLDSYKAGSLLRILRKLASQNCTVIFTIHQPSYLLYSMLSNIILLDKGKIIYQGNNQQISRYMQSLNIKISLKSTISDFFMWEISNFNQQKNNYKTPLNYQNYSIRIAPRITKQIQLLQNQQTGYQRLLAVRGFMFMFTILLKREWNLFIRNPMKVFGNVINTAISIIMVGLFFINQIKNPQELLENGLNMTNIQVTILFIGIQGVTFVSIVFNLMSGVFTVLLTFPVERQIYFKETSSKKYYPIAYFLSKVLIELFNKLIGTILYGSSIYWILGFQYEFIKFLKFLIVTIFVGFAGMGIGFFIGALFKTARQSTAMSKIIIMPFMFFSGMYNKINDIPDWIAWMQYVSPFRYALHLLLVNQYQDLVITLKDGSFYDYKTDLTIQQGYSINLVYFAVLTSMFYVVSFLLLRFSSDSLSA